MHYYSKKILLPITCDFCLNAFVQTFIHDYDYHHDHQKIIHNPSGMMVLLQ